MKKSLAEIAKLIHGEVIGNKDLIITGLNGIYEASEGDLTFVANHKYFSQAKETKASAILVPRDFKSEAKPVILTDNPSVAFDQLLAMESSQLSLPIKGIHSTAIISKSASLGKDVAIGPYVVIEDDVEIGDHSTIQAGSFVGYKTKLGKHCMLYPHVIIRERSILGQRVMIHSGTVIGSDGFGYEFVDGKQKKQSQIGIVVIEDDVEIGANVTIDRARFDKTIIGNGTKIDNLVQIGHNVQIKENCIIISQVGISGSTIIERNCILAGQAGISGHIRIGEGSIVFAKSGVPQSIPAGSKIFGYPAIDHMEAKRLQIHTQKLPEYAKKIKELEQRIKDLESQTKSKL